MLSKSLLLTHIDQYAQHTNMLSEIIVKKQPKKQQQQNKNKNKPMKIVTLHIWQNMSLKRMSNQQQQYYQQ